MLRHRTDIEVSRRLVRGREHFVLKDPVRFAFHQLTPPEFFLWQQLDGRKSVEEICEAYERRFPPQQLTPLDLQRFSEQLHRDGLIIADVWRQGEVLRERQQKANWSRWRRTLSNPLAIRLPGFHPRHLLRWFAPIGAIAFSPWLTMLGLVFIMASLLLAGLQFYEFQIRVLESSQLANWPMIALAIALLKIPHEFGHGLLCRKFGRECHEVGLLLLVFTPAVYCDVSDTWMLQSKWRRAAVAGVGIWVELILATAFGWLWWFSEPGWFHTLSLHVMLIGSLNSLLLNGNPLLRFDGYYVLSDLAEFPNLAERSRRAIIDLFKRWVFGISSPALESRRDRRWLLLYGSASLLYKVFLVTLILWACYRWLEPYRLEALVWLLFITVISEPIRQAIIGLYRIMQHPQSRRRGFRQRLAMVAATGVVLVGLLWIPLPRNIAGRGEVRFTDEQVVRVVVDGRLVEAVAAGTTVKAGATLARLENDVLQRQVAELLEQRAHLRGQIEEQQALRNLDPDAARKIPEWEKELAGLAAELASRRRDLSRLTLTATRDGVVAPPPRQADQSTAFQLPTWTGTPLDAANRGCYLEADTTLCRLGNPERLSVVVNISPASIGAVAPQQEVRVRLPSVKRTLTGRVVSISQLNRESQSELANLGGPPEDETAGHYAVIVQLENASLPLPVGATGKVKIKVAPLSIARRLQHWTGRTFRLRL